MCLMKSAKKWGINSILLHTFIFCILSCSLYFLYFQLLIKMLNFIFIEVTWILGFLGWLNFVQKVIKRTRFMSACKMINLFEDTVKREAFPHKAWVMGRGVPQDYNNKGSRPSVRFMDTRTQLKSKNFPGCKQILYVKRMKPFFEFATYFPHSTHLVN